MMRGLDTTVRRIRRKVFEEVARLGFQSNDDTLNDDMEAIPYIPGKSYCQREAQTRHGAFPASGE